MVAVGPTVWRQLKVNGSGAANIDTLALEAQDVTVDLSGAGAARVHAVQNLQVDVSGAGSVSYKGEPQVRKQVSGVGSVQALGS